jgi:hypothetical protein
MRVEEKKVVDSVNEAPIGMVSFEKYEDRIGFTWDFIFVFFCVGQCPTFPK